MLCPKCMAELGRGKNALGRHRKNCPFLEGTPWGAWQEHVEWWTRRAERSTGDAYMNAARLLFYLVANKRQPTLLHQLRDDLESSIRAYEHAIEEWRKQPDIPSNSDGQERVKGHHTTIMIIGSRIDELKSMATYLGQV